MKGNLMNAYRRMAVAVITGAAGLSLAACTVGISSAGPGTSLSPSASRAGSSPTVPSSHSAPPQPSPAATVSVNAPISSFPIPAGAAVVYNISCARLISIIVSPVTPSQSSAFYTTALPRAGYKIEDNITTADPNTGAAQGLAEIEFSGHGYKGTIATMANLGAEASADPSLGTLPSDMTKNVEEITLTASGTPGSYTCPT
jgi:hypothetical protein